MIPIAIVLNTLKKKTWNTKNNKITHKIPEIIYSVTVLLLSQHESPRQNDVKKMWKNEKCVWKIFLAGRSHNFAFTDNIKIKIAVKMLVSMLRFVLMFFNVI